jgi:MerC mercury resistance protein
MKLEIIQPPQQHVAPQRSAVSLGSVQSVGDTIGMIASIICAVHCALLPLAALWLPTLGSSWMIDDVVHKWMFGICLVVGIVAFVPGLRVHGRWLPVVLGSAGLMLIGAAAFASSIDIASIVKSTEATGSLALMPADVRWWITPAGGSILVLAHYLNHRFSCPCCKGKCPAPAHSHPCQ